MECDPPGERHRPIHRPVRRWSVMDGYLQFKQKIRERMEALEGTIRDLESFQVVEPSETARWREQMGRVEAAIQADFLRIAVAGSVKSGKSTLINTLVGRDFLKRGAGIITAFLTRIRTGGEPGGWVELKSWSEVEDQVTAAVRALPLAPEGADAAAAPDLRRPEDRARLESILEKMRTEWLQTTGHLDSGFISLKAFLEGYPALHREIGDAPARIVLDRNSVVRHQAYVGQESHAVYVRDVELRLPVEWLGENVEIADCQGADSPNPLHFELIQQHLLRSHFILYVIGSRTGLREADFKLLDFIKTLKMFPQTLFILNVDMDSHHGIEDLEGLTKRVESELTWLVPEPRIFAFSSLYHLAAQLGKKAPERERKRYGLWKEEGALAGATEEGFDSFKKHLVRRISAQRGRTLLGCGLSRLGAVAGSILDTSHAGMRFLAEDSARRKEMAGRIGSSQKALQATLGTLQNAISGLRDSLREELDAAAEAFFDPETGPIVTETLRMVDGYSADPGQLKELADQRQYMAQIHRFYLEFRQSLARYLVEKVNVRVIEFAKEQEIFLEERFARSSRAFWFFFATAVEDYRRDLARFQVRVSAAGEATEYGERPSMEKTAPPPFSAFVNQEALGRGVIVMKFGIGRLTRLLMDIKTRMGQRARYPDIRPRENHALAEAVSLVKAEAKAELLEAFRNYRKSFREDYLHRMLNDGILFLMQEFRARTEMTRVGFAEGLEKEAGKPADSGTALDALTRAAGVAEAVAAEVDGFRCAVNLEWPKEGEGATAAAEARPEPGEPPSPGEEAPAGTHEEKASSPPSRRKGGPRGPGSRRRRGEAGSGESVP